MDPLLISAASGMKSRMETLDVLANDIANSATAGFKADGEFYGLYEQQLPILEKQWTDFSQGTLVSTGNPLDLALSGDGFFALNSPAGKVYSRKGEFRLSKNNEIQTAEGYTLRNAADNGNPIQVDPAKPLEISADGAVLQSGKSVGQIEIASIDSPSQALNKLGNSYFAKLKASGSSNDGEASARVHQGMLEQSNVGVADAAVKLVNVMRQFEMLQKAMSAGSDMNRQAIEEVAKVS
jgi:flagellar basal body rod protein FlgG